MKKFLSVILLLGVLLSLCACSGSGGYEVETSGNAESGDKEPFNYVTLQEKSEWRELLIQRIRALKEAEGENSPRNLGIGLIDVDLDGTPEVAYSTPGGTAGNTCFGLFDLKSGEEVGFFSPGWYGGKELGELALYLDTEVGRYIYAGLCNYRSGWQETYREVYTIAHMDESPYYRQKSLFEEHFIYSEPTGAQGPVPTTYVEHFIGGTQVTYEEYISKCDVFWQRLMKIEGSDFIHIEWDSLTGEGDLTEAMADALINSTQVFVKGDVIAEG